MWWIINTQFYQNNNGQIKSVPNIFAVCRVNPDIRKDDFLLDIMGKKICLLKMFLNSFNVAEHSSSTLRSFLKFWDLSWSTKTSLSHRRFSSQWNWPTSSCAILVSYKSISGSNNFDNHIGKTCQHIHLSLEAAMPLSSLVSGEWRPPT